MDLKTYPNEKTTFFLLSLLTVFVFTACSDGLDNIEYNRNSDVVLTTPEATATGTSLNVKSSITGNLSSVVKRGFCYSVNVSNPTIYNPQIQISAESETKRSIFREKDKTKRSKKESAQHSKSRNKSFVMTSVSAL